MSQVAPSRRRTGPSKGDLREAAILRSARQLFTERSYDTVTIDDLAGAAGISRTSFYFYFPTKTAVLTALTEQVWTELGESHAWFDSDGPQIELLRAQMQTSARLARDNWGIMSCATSAPPLRDFLTRIKDRYVARAATKIARDQAAGHATTAIPADRLAEMIAAMRDARYEQLSTATDADLTTAVDQLVEAVHRLAYRP